MSYGPAQADLYPLAGNETPMPRAGFSLTGATLGNLWLGLLCFALLGYALFGKGWAYLGIPPIFIGELILLAGVLALLAARQWQRVLNLSLVWCLIALAVWGLIRTLPYVGVYGIDAPRDAMIWGYATFAVVVAGLILAEPSRLAMLFQRYRHFMWIFLLAAPAIWLVTRLFEMPRWPGSGVAIVQMKGGDVLVHLAGILAFCVAGFCGRVRIGWIVLLAGSFVMIGVKDRAGMVSFLAVFTVCMVFKPLNSYCWRFIGVLLAGLLVAAATDLRLELYSRNRTVSFNQVVTNLVSTVTNSGHAGLDGTKTWRLNWWGDIVGYTIHGKYFWTGKGFGINLADEDGYQGTRWEGRIRSPHNGHMTMLARAGVPGVALWGLVQLGWALGMLHRHYQAKGAGNSRWAAVFQFLFCYWLAFIVNASFDVFIEGPMGGIWLWTVYGAGMAAMWAYKHRPEVLGVDEEEPARPRLAKTATLDRAMAER